MIYIGIDPGQAGAIAFLDSSLGDLVALHKIPLHKVQVSDKERKRVDERALLALLTGFAGCRVALERPTIRPMKSRDKQDGTLKSRTPGAAGMFAFGEGFGILRMACIAAGLVIRECSPTEWKAGIRLRGGKDDSRRRASDEFPLWVGNFAAKGADGSAEAALMALWLSRQAALCE